MFVSDKDSVSGPFPAEARIRYFKALRTSRRAVVMIRRFGAAFDAVNAPRFCCARSASDGPCRCC